LPFTVLETDADTDVFAPEEADGQPMHAD